ncbi:MAG: 4-(cytidine 5'-diphospho)-2-C-methyl-D-erythritol kinase [Rhodothermia bacterium]|nr:4-(cytidine 5'-diphospho)-2-C-methyl-D-erythritol kinase [Rhodothermia bacterium]
MMPEHPAYAKINLGLHVLSRRDDGFHEIETVMLRIGWADRLRLAVRDDSDIVFGCSDPDLPTDQSNTCVRAASLLRQRFSVDRGVDIYLDKRVPYGAGLGSGSSDAATVLTVLRNSWGLDCSDEELIDIAAEIGSDVPFFIRGLPALATGRGTELVQLRCSGTPFELTSSIAVVVPRLHVSTREAYAAVRPRSTSRPDLTEVVCTRDMARWCEELTNDFEAPLRSRHEELDEVFRAFASSEASYVCLSGSGSAVFALFKSAEQARSALSQEQFAQMRTWHGTAV